jgi:hypothetical protein
MKKRFRVLLLAQEYSFATQAQIIPALAVLHNFISLHDPGKTSELELELETGSDADDAWSIHQAAIPREERTRAAKHRDRIASEMWKDYTARHRNRQL